MPTKEWIEVPQPESSSTQVFPDNSLLVKHNLDVLLAYQTGFSCTLSPSYATALALVNFLEENEPEFESSDQSNRDTLAMIVPGYWTLHWRWSRTSGAFKGSVSVGGYAPRLPGKPAAKLPLSLTGRKAYLQGCGNQIRPADVQALHQQMKTVRSYYHHWDDGETLFIENPKSSGEFWKFRMSDWSFINTVHYDVLQPRS
ncbi:hypothetical protein M3J07_013827 [Ascochyta lentis]